MNKAMAIAIMILVQATNGMAQTKQGIHPEVPEDQQVQKMREVFKAGEMFNVRVVPKDGQAAVYIVGKKAVDVKMDDLKIEAIFYEGLNAEKGRTLFLKKQKDHFLYEGSLAPGKLQLNIQSPSVKEPEKLEMKLESP